MFQLFRIAVLVSVAASCVAAEPSVQLLFRDGRVWLVTDGASVGQILAEWGRVGGAHVVNGDRIVSESLSLEMRGVPESEALDVVLRSTGGFIAARRTTGQIAAANLSRFDRIVVLPAAVRTDPVIGAGAASPLPIPPPAIRPPQPIFDVVGGQRIIGANGEPVPDDQDGAPPFFSPSSSASTPAAAAKPRAVPVVLPGVATPGMVPPAQQKAPQPSSRGPSANVR